MSKPKTETTSTVTPEHLAVLAKWAAISKERAAIEEFLDFLVVDEYGSVVRLARSRSGLLDKFYDIDRRKLEEARQALIADVRRHEGGIRLIDWWSGITLVGALVALILMYDSHRTWRKTALLLRTQVVAHQKREEHIVLSEIITLGPDGALVLRLQRTLLSAPALVRLRDNLATWARRAFDREVRVLVLEEGCTLESVQDEFRREWAERFGFLAVQHPPDSLESIDEVACILNERGNLCLPVPREMRPAAQEPSK